MFVRSQNPFNLCNPWSKNYSLLFFGGTSVKSVYNQCNGNVRAQPKSAISVIRGPKRRLLFIVYIRAIPL